MGKKSKKISLSAIHLNRSAVFVSPNIPAVFFILAAVTFLLFWQTTGFGLVWDDVGTHLTENPFLKPPWLPNLLHFWRESHEKLYIPMAYTLWGALKMIGNNSPFVYHLANIFLHTGNSLLVFLLINHVINKPWPSLAGALVFIVHPVQVESVAWISEFRGLLAAFWGFLFLYAYLLACEKKYKIKVLSQPLVYLIPGWICLSLALLSKPSAAVLPLFAIIIQIYLYQPSFKRLAADITPFLIPVVTITIITARIQTNFVTYPFWKAPFIWADAICFYMYKLFFPISLSASYARTPDVIMTQWWFYLSWIIPVGMGWSLWVIQKKNPLLVLSALLFLTGFLPVSGLKPFTFQSWSTVADRYLYLSMLGVGLAVAWIFTRLKQPWHLGMACMALLFFAGISGFYQVPTWKNSLTLWNHAIDQHPGDYRALFNRGKVYFSKNNVDMALSDFNRVILLNPSDSDVFNIRGKIFSQRQDYQKALADFSQAIVLNPKNYQAYNNRANLYAKNKEYLQALQDFNQAIDLNPDYADAFYNRGLLHEQTQAYDKALGDYHSAIAINPRRAEYYNNRGILLAMKKEYLNAIADFNRAVDLNPEYADAFNNRAVTFYHMGDYQKALADMHTSETLGKMIHPAFKKELMEKAGKPK